MIWVTWRQHRTLLLASTGLLAAMLAALLLTGLGIAHTFQSSGLAACLAVPTRDCNELASAFSDHYSGLGFLVPLFLVLPALLGVFWGAPLVAREIEQGTHRLAWSQSVTRDRWLGTKLLMLATATAIGAAIFTLVLNWWSRPLVLASDNRLDPGIFDLRGFVPVAYALFVLALGVAAGSLIRRLIPAMLTTVAGYTVIRFLVATFVRPHYMAARVRTYSFLGPEAGGRVGDWVLSRTTLDRAGHVVGAGHELNLNALVPRCPGLIPNPGTFPDKDPILACVQHLGFRIQAVYQPGSRYWAFQGIETAIFVALAAALFAISFWWVRRRV
jgi:hypothetical protein